MQSETTTVKFNTASLSVKLSNQEESAKTQIKVGEAVDMHCMKWSDLTMTAKPVGVHIAL